MPLTIDEFIKFYKEGYIKCDGVSNEWVYSMLNNLTIIGVVVSHSFEYSYVYIKKQINNTNIIIGDDIKEFNECDLENINTYVNILCDRYNTILKI